MAQLKNLIVNGASRFLTPIKGDLSGTSDYSLKMETYKQGSSTETYGTAYPLWAQWETSTVLKLLCTGYSTKVDIANSAGDADTVDGHHFHWSGQSGQPTWVWGGNDSANMYVYNPLNFSVEKSRIVQGNYTTNGGQQNPNYFGKNNVGFLMMNTTVNGNSQYKDWIIMDCYSGTDVGGGVALGVNRQSLGAYIMRSPAERTSWTESAELLHTSNYNNYAPTKTGGGASGTWGINITGTANLLNINGMSASSNYGTTAGIIQDTTNGPESGSWHNTLRVLHNNSQGYYTSIAVNFTGTDGMWFGSNRAGTKTWRRVFADNYLDVGKATTGTLAVARGGTGKTTGNAAANYFINELTTGSSNPTDADYYVCQYAGGGTSTTTYHRRPHSALYNYIVGKADSRYAKATHYHSILYPGGDSTKVGVRAVWVSDSNAYFFRPMSESQDRSPKYHLGSSSYRWDSTYMQGTLYIADQMGEYYNGKISGIPDADLGKITACDNVTVDGTVTAWKLKATDSKIQCQPTYDGTTTYATNVYVGTSGLFSRTTNTSSRTIKNSIDILKEPFLLAENLYNLPVHQFKYNDFIITDTTDQRYGKLLPGFIIEEMDEIYPIAVDKPTEDVKQWSWNAQYLIPPMLKLIQNQKEQLDKCQEEINGLKKLVNKLLEKLN